jgi:conjugative relaxase-like TrwC/TraI family protein
MLKVTPISDIAYLTESAADTPTAAAYYTDATSEPPAVWWCPGSWTAKDGGRAAALAVTRLSQGRHPKSGRQIVSGKGDKKRAAIDLTFSAPKSWTALWVVSDRPGRVMLDEMLMASVRESLDEVLASGLIEARLGKGGAIREAMSGLVAALYRHTTSREGDPQAHVHAALLNIGMRQDGQIRAINNEKLCEVHKVIGAAFRLRLAEKLETYGVPVRADLEHGFVIDGQPSELADIWSKRRKQIVEAARDDGMVSTAGRLKRIDKIVKKTRGKKADLPGMDALESRWRKEALATGWMPQVEWSRLDRPPITRRVDQDEGEVIAVVREAIANITEKQSIFYRREVEAMALTLAVGRSSALAVRKALELIMAGPEIVDLHNDGMLTTKLIIAQEQEIVQIARSRQNERDTGFSEAAMQVALADPKFSVEQKDAIAHALASHGVSVVEGGPGVGKTTAAAALKAACLHDGRRLILAAPSWTAAETLKKELEYDGPALALDKLLFELKTGKMMLRRGDVILLDEAGMTSTLQMLALMRAAQQAGAKLILQGDSNQIAAVSRGDPLALISKAIGSQQIRTIRRQKIAWQRDASMAVQQGEIAQAVTAYCSHGAVNVADDQEATLAAMATAFKQAKGDAAAIAATNAQVGAINEVLRQAAREIGVISGPEIVIRAVPRGQKGSKPKPVELALAKGDRLILGGATVIGGLTLRNAAKLTVKYILPGGKKLLIETADGHVLMTSPDELARAGKGGKPIVMQHAYAVTTHAAQGGTWSRTLWLASHEDSRSALVAMTRHRDELAVFVDRSSLPNYADAAMNISRQGLADPEPPVDDRSAMEIVAALGKSMERVKVPRNALDVLGMPDEAETKVTNAARPEILSEPPPRSPMRRGLIQGASPQPVTDSAEHDVPEVGQDDDVLAEFGEEADLGDNLSPELDHSMMPAP